VICCTAAACGDKRLKLIEFPYLLIDESTQSMEPETLICLVKGIKHIILIGDHC
jgi:regulator of nonsense transcripts 1